jgi:hypothetical protein
VVFLIALRLANDAPAPISGLDQLWALSIYATGRRVGYR